MRSNTPEKGTVESAENLQKVLTRTAKLGPRRLRFANLPRATLSGTAQLSMGRDHMRILTGETLSPCFIELRGDVLCVHKGEPKEGKEPEMVEVVFCERVAPPGDSWRRTPEIVAQAVALAKYQVLAVYSAAGASWFKFESAAERLAWETAINERLLATEGKESQEEKAAAFKKLQPMLWDQLASQANRFHTFAGEGWNQAMLGDESHIHGDESLNAWAHVERSIERGIDEIPAERLYCGLCDSLVTLYPDRESPAIVDLLYLEHATVRVEIERCELQLTTPLTSMSLRFDDDKECFKWAKAIETVRAALKVKATSPNRRRVSPIVQQISRRGLEAKLRANRADVGDDMGKLIAAEQAASELESHTVPQTFLEDPGFHGLLESFALERGAGIELQLLSNREGAPGSSAAEGAGADELMRHKRFAGAARRMSDEVLPEFYDSAQFRDWLAARKEERRVKLSLQAALSEPTGAEAARAHLRAEGAEEALDLMLHAEKVIGAFDEDGDTALAQARALCSAHLRSSSFSPEVASGLVEALQLPADEAAAEVPATLESLVDGLQRQVVHKFHDFELSPQFALHLRKLEEAQLETLDLVHWLHCRVGVETLRAWLVETQAQENLDFLCDVLKFKAAKDDAATAATAAEDIRCKFITEGAESQVALPSAIAARIEDTIAGGAVGENVFDDASESVLATLRQDLWVSFTEAPVYATTATAVRGVYSGLPPSLLVVKNGDERHVMYLMKKLVTVGSAPSCDIVLKRQPAATVFWIEKVASGYAVAVLWQHGGETNVKPRRLEEGEKFNLGAVQAMIMPVGVSFPQGLPF